jgi:ferric-dicitrate binding protein FerR (iron transport regulator)
MTNEQTTPQNSNGNDDTLAALIRSAGKRPEPRVADYERVLAASRTAWQGKVRTRRRTRWLQALAASIVVAVAVALGVTQMTAPPPAAMLAELRGPVEMLADDGRWLPLSRPRQIVPAGSRLRTAAAAGAVLALERGAALQLHALTEVTLASATRIELIAGTVYYDSGVNDAPPIEIATPFGTIRDVGTQFEVFAAAAGVRIRVREGSVEVLDSAVAAPLTGSAGEQVSVDDRGAVDRQPFATDAPEWDWTAVLGDTLVVDGRTVFEVLSWVARETGKTLRFVDPTAEQRARGATLLGGGVPLTPREALDVVVGTAEGLDIALVPGGIVVTPR